MEIDFKVRNMVEKMLNVNPSIILQQIQCIRDEYGTKYGVKICDRIGSFNLNNIQITNLKSNIKYVIFYLF